MSTLLPLFPLDVVLLPGAPLPLHIFEPRYKEMISECLDQKRPFGVVRVKEEGVAEIGCTAEIISVAKKYPDGRMENHRKSSGHKYLSTLLVHFRSISISSRHCWA